MPAELKTAKVNLEALLEILGKNLYSTPHVVIRELIQNGIDSITRRLLEENSIISDPDYQPKVHVFAETDNREIHIVDNGAGMTFEEVELYLATVGSGYTRKLRKESESSKLIGYFGLGFLTSYSVSRQVKVYTSSYKEPGKQNLFFCNDGRQFGIEQGPFDGPAGTRVVLTLKDDFFYLADNSVLFDIVSRYCSLLEVPVEVGTKGAVNQNPPPWRASIDPSNKVALQKGYLEFAKSKERHLGVITAFPLQVTGKPDKTINGVFWVHDSGTYGTTDNRNISVYIRNMLISSDIRKLIPHWAGFFGGVVSADHLQPTASREELMENSDYFELQEILQEFLIKSLASLAEKNDAAWRLVTSRHNEALLGAAISEEALFSALCEKLRIYTSEGELEITALVKESGGKVFVSMNEQPGFEELLFKAMKKPVASGWRFGVYSIIRKYCLLKNIPVVVLGTSKGNQVLFNNVSLQESDVISLKGSFLAEGERLETVVFEPSYIPVVVMSDQDVLLKKKIEADDTDERISSGALALARQFTGTIEKDEERVVYVNTGSPIIRRFLSTNQEGRSQIAAVIRPLANILSSSKPGSGPSLDSELKNLFGAIEKSVMEGERS